MIKIIPYCVYPFSLMVITDTSYEELKAELLKSLPDKVHDRIEILNNVGDARTVMFETGQTCMVLNKKTPGTIAHEVFHAVEFLMDRIGIKLDPNSDEAYAYLTGYITDEIYKIIDHE